MHLVTIHPDDAAELVELQREYEGAAAQKHATRVAFYRKILAVVDGDSHSADVTQVELGARLGKSRSRAQQLINQARRELG